MERRLRSDGDTRPLVVLDPRRPAREEDLDAAVRAAASLCVHLARAGGCALLLPGDRRPTVLESTLIGWPHLHVRLALVDDRTGPERGRPGLAPRARCSTSPPTIRARAPRALGHARRRRALPDRARRRRPARARARRPAHERRAGGRRAVFTVAGCTGYELSGSRRVAEVA